jgi:hypothetical protein
VGIGQNTVELPYRPFSDWAGKSDNFQISHTVHLGFPALFICVGHAIFFLFNSESFQIFK